MFCLGDTSKSTLTSAAHYIHRVTEWPWEINAAIENVLYLLRYVACSSNIYGIHVCQCLNIAVLVNVLYKLKKSETDGCPWQEGSLWSMFQEIWISYRCVTCIFQDRICCITVVMAVTRIVGDMSFYIGCFIMSVPRIPFEGALQLIQID